MPGRMEKPDFEGRTPVLHSIMQQPSRQGSEIEGCLPLHTPSPHHVPAGWQSNGKRQEGCRRPGRVTPVPPQRLGFMATVACGPAPPNLAGALSSTEGSQVQGLFTQTNKSSDSGQAWEQQRGEDTCMSAGGLSCCSAALAAAAKGTSLPWLRVPPKQAISRWCFAPHPCYLTLALPLSLLHRPWGCWLVRLKQTGHHFNVIFLESKQHLTLFLSWWAARKVSCPATFLVVATIAVRHCSIFKLTSNSLSALLQMNRQKTSWADRGALLHQSLDFSLSAKQRIQTPTMSSLLQTKSIYNLSKPGSGRAIQTVSSTS